MTSFSVKEECFIVDIWHIECCRYMHFETKKKKKATKIFFLFLHFMQHVGTIKNVFCHVNVNEAFYRAQETECAEIYVFI